MRRKLQVNSDGLSRCQPLWQSTQAHHPRFTLLLCDLRLSWPSSSHPKSPQEVICKDGLGISKRQRGSAVAGAETKTFLSSFSGGGGRWSVWSVRSPSSWLLKAAHSGPRQDDTLSSPCFPSLLPSAGSGPQSPRKSALPPYYKNCEKPGGNCMTLDFTPRQHDSLTSCFLSTRDQPLKSDGCSALPSSDSEVFALGLSSEPQIYCLPLMFLPFT